MRRVETVYRVLRSWSTYNPFQIPDVSHVMYPSILSNRNPQVVEEAKRQAKSLGLWNLFLPSHPDHGGLSNLEYAPLCEILGRSLYEGRIDFKKAQKRADDLSAKE